MRKRTGEATLPLFYTILPLLRSHVLSLYDKVDQTPQ